MPFFSDVRSTSAAILGSLCMLSGGIANAGQLVVDVAGIESRHEYGFREGGNVLMTFALGANAHLTNVSYDLTLTAYAPSFLSDIGVDFSGTSNTQYFDLFPIYQNHDAPGTFSAARSYNLSDFGADFNLDDDGILYLEFFENHDDGLNPDGIWDSGTMTIDYTTAAPVPEPETVSLMLCGLGFVTAMSARRRRLKRVTTP